jgi:beta-lactamase class A
LFTEPIVPDWFAASFLQRVPIDLIEGIPSKVAKGLGSFKSVRREGEAYVTEFERGSVPTEAQLDGDGRFVRLFFRPSEMRAIPLQEAVAAFRGLRGESSVEVLTDGAERASLRPDEAMAVGSAFKLVVLAALREDIDAKKRSWADVVTLLASDKSLPTGTLQKWPVGSLLTLESLASLMISQSDNTAADVLLRVTGRAHEEALSPRNTPFLSTREAFVLKAADGSSLLDRFRSSDPVNRRKVLGEIAALDLPNANKLSPSPTALDIEWLLSTRELCAFMNRVQDLPSMSINAGVAHAHDWEHIAYKGGSEPGVINMTTALRGGGHAHCVSATWNDKSGPLDEAEFASVYGQLITSVR